MAPSEDLKGQNNLGGASGTQFHLLFNRLLTYWLGFSGKLLSQGNGHQKDDTRSKICQLITCNKYDCSLHLQDANVDANSATNAVDSQGSRQGGSNGDGYSNGDEGMKYIDEMLLGVGTQFQETQGQDNEREGKNGGVN